MGFTFNGKTSDEMGIKIKRDAEQRIPDVRNLTDRIAGRHGVFDFGETLSEREITLTCFIPPGKSDRDFLAAKDRIMGWLNPDNGLCSLSFDSEPGRVYYARLKDGVTYERIVRNTGTFDLTFFCPDPFAYAVPDEVFSLTASADIRREKGNCDSAPEYEIKASLEDNTKNVRISVNNETLEIKGPLSLTETMIVNAGDMTAKIVTDGGTERNALSQMAAFNFPYLKPGANTVTIGGEDGALSLLIIHAKSRWL